MAATSTVPRCLALLLLLHSVSVTFATPVTTTTPPSGTTTDGVTAPDVIADDDASDTTETDDVTEEAMKLISDIRQFAVVAKKGMALPSISEGAEKLKERAEKLREEVSDDANGCESNFVIKMAATRIGSPEILALLQAEDQMGVLNARLSMSFGFLQSVAQMIEDELALSTDIAGHLEALAFGADMTDSIAQTSDTLLRDSAPNSKVNNVVKRQYSVGVKPTYTKQDGLGVTGNVNYKSKDGRLNLGLSPSYTQHGGLGVSGNVGYKTKDNRLSLGLTPSYTKQSGLAVSGNVGYKSKNGRLSWGVSPSWSQGGGFGVGAGLSYSFGK